MSSKYLFEKHYGTETIRKLFNSCSDLFSYLQEEGECIFNAGFQSAEINLYRIHLEGEIDEQ